MLPTRTELLLLVKKGMSQSDIAAHYKVSRQAVNSKLKYNHKRRPHANKAKSHPMTGRYAAVTRVAPRIAPNNGKRLTLLKCLKTLGWCEDKTRRTVLKKRVSIYERFDPYELEPLYKKALTSNHPDLFVNAADRERQTKLCQEIGRAYLQARKLLALDGPEIRRDCRHCPVSRKCKKLGKDKVCIYSEEGKYIGT
jgi:hypothetical protein